MNLSEFAQTFLASRGVSSGYAATVLRRCKALENHVGRPEIAACLTIESVNRLLELIAQTRAPRTVKGWRGDILTVWRGAADESLATEPVARKIRRVRLPRLIVRCYTVDEARAILQAATALRGEYPWGVGRSDYWGAAIRLGWDSGLRRGDCWRFGEGSFDSRGEFEVVQGKTGEIASGILRPDTCEAIRRVGSLAWMHHPNAFTKQFAAMVRRSGVNRGSFKWLRRASGSYAEAKRPGTGHTHLGQKTRATFEQHYDAKLGRRQFGPPQL